VWKYYQQLCQLLIYFEGFILHQKLLQSNSFLKALLSVRIKACITVRFELNSWRSIFKLMEMTEQKIRQIAEEAQKQLGSQANPAMVKKVVKEVVRRLQEEATKSPASSKY